MLTVSVLCFSARALKKNIFFDVDIVAKKNRIVVFRGLYSYRQRVGVITCFRNITVSVLSGYDELLRDDKFATLTSSFLKFCNS